ncbi:MAG: hypothetical protein KDB36_09705, partial [Acidimicrobiales bacterium]|nr:hypothetical protein [Acidimicrobiales bacterium]
MSETVREDGVPRERELDAVFADLQRAFVNDPPADVADEHLARLAPPATPGSGGAPRRMLLAVGI